MDNLGTRANTNNVLEQDEGELEYLSRLLDDLAREHKAGFFAQARAEQLEHGPTRGSYSRTLRRARDLACIALGEWAAAVDKQAELEKLGREMDDLAANHEAIYLEQARAQLADQDPTGNSYGRVIALSRDLACQALGEWSAAVDKAP